MIEDVDSEDEMLEIVDEEAEFNLDIPMEETAGEDMPAEMLFSLSRRKPSKATSMQKPASFSLMRLENSLVRYQRQKLASTSFEDKLGISPGNSRSNSFADSD